MTVAGEVLFFILVLINLATIVKLGWPWTYRDRGVSWYLWGTAWSAVLFDSGFLAAILMKASNVWLQSALLAALGLRVLVSAWLLWMVASGKDRNGTNAVAQERGSDPRDPVRDGRRSGWPRRSSRD